MSFSNKFLYFNLEKKLFSKQCSENKVCFKKTDTLYIGYHLYKVCPVFFETDFSNKIKVIYTKYSKHCPYTVAHTFECVCSKINNS